MPEIEWRNLRADQLREKARDNAIVILPVAVPPATPGAVAAQATPGGVRLRIADDGAGFDPGKLEGNGNGHFGWRGIRERATQIGAEVQLDTQPGRGTIVTVTVPLPA